MNYQEAISILEVQSGSDEKTIKKSFRDLSTRYHPDKNKEEGAEKKYKSITAAYTFLKENNFQEPDPIQFNPFGGEDEMDFGPFHGNFSFFVNGKRVENSGYSANSFFKEFQEKAAAQRQAQIKEQEKLIQNTIFVNVSIPLEKALLGCVEKISYNRREPCTTCSSLKDSTEGLPKKCEECNAQGKLINPGVALKHKEVNLTIKPFLSNRIILNLAKAGHQDADRKWDVRVIVSILFSDEDKFKVRGNFNNELWSKEKISLLQALKGGEIEIDTIRGKEKINIPPKISNGYLYRKPETGLPDINVSVIEFEVEYPKDTDKLINFLETEGK